MASIRAFSLAEAGKSESPQFVILIGFIAIVTQRCQLHLPAKSAKRGKNLLDSAGQLLPKNKKH
jgi:hypothetical protein